GIVRDWNDYMRLFLNAHNQHAVGEASVGYLWSRTAAAGIANRFPQARILMVLRSPAERAFSQYLHNMSDGFIAQPFRDYVRASQQGVHRGLGVHEPFLEMGLYADQVQRFFDRFPAPADRHLAVRGHQSAAAAVHARGARFPRRGQLLPARHRTTLQR